METPPLTPAAVSFVALHRRDDEERKRAERID
jgi:hypothetical protein